MEWNEARGAVNSVAVGKRWFHIGRMSDQRSGSNLGFIVQDVATQRAVAQELGPVYKVIDV